MIIEIYDVDLGKLGDLDTVMKPSTELNPYYSLVRSDLKKKQLPESDLSITTIMSDAGGWAKVNYYDVESKIVAIEWFCFKADFKDEVVKRVRFWFPTVKPPKPLPIPQSKHFIYRRITAPSEEYDHVSKELSKWHNILFQAIQREHKT